MTNTRPKYAGFGDWMRFHVGSLRWARDLAPQHLLPHIRDAFAGGHLNDAQRLSRVYIHRATPADARGALEIGRRHVEAGLIDGALVPLRMAWHAGAVRSGHSLQALAYALTFKGQLGQARYVLEQGLQRRPHDPVLLAELANVVLLDAINDFDAHTFYAGRAQAERLYQQAAAIAPHDPALAQNRRVLRAITYGPAYGLATDQLRPMRYGITTPIKTAVLAGLRANTVQMQRTLPPTASFMLGGMVAGANNGYWTQTGPVFLPVVRQANKRAIAAIEAIR